LEKEQTVLEMAEEVLVRQAEDLAAQTGQPFGRALEAVRDTEAGQQLRALAESEYRLQRAAQWQASLRPKRIQERHYSSWVESYMERLEGKEERGLDPGRWTHQSFGCVSRRRESQRCREQHHAIHQSSKQRPFASSAPLQTNPPPR
jgi:hypothetical protein